jgi:serine/threonine-protein kinase RsbW
MSTDSPKSDSPKFSFDAQKLVLKLKITLAAHPNLVDSVVESVMDQIRKAQCAGDKADALELALTEALANAVVHGAKGDASKVIECDLMCDQAQRVLIVVRDPGQGFDLSSIPNPMNGDRLYSDHGRGIFLINQLMDEVKFLKNGAEIHMLKR